jgi:hypothetical protein
MVAADDADYFAAVSLFLGMQFPKSLAQAGKFPSAMTTPTEKEARAALARLLTRPDPPAFFLLLLAAAIDPDGDYGNAQRRIVFKNLTRGHSTAHREFLIASALHKTLKGAKSRKQAFGKVGDLTGMGQRHLERVYARHRSLFEASRELYMRDCLAQVR